MRRRRPEPEGQSDEVPAWIADPPRWIYIDDGLPSPDGPNESWRYLESLGHEAGPGADIRMRGLWHDERNRWCVERGLVLQAAECGRAIVGPVNATWIEARRLVTA